MAKQQNSLNSLFVKIRVNSRANSSSSSPFVFNEKQGWMAGWLDSEMAKQQNSLNPVIPNCPVLSSRTQRGISGGWEVLSMSRGKNKSEDEISPDGRDDKKGSTD